MRGEWKNRKINRQLHCQNTEETMSNIWKVEEKCHEAEGDIPISENVRYLENKKEKQFENRKKNGLKTCRQTG